MKQEGGDNHDNEGILRERNRKEVEHNGYDNASTSAREDHVDNLVGK